MLAALLHPVLVQGGVPDRLRLERHVAVLDEILHQTLEDDVRRNALAQQLVQAVTDLAQPCRRLLRDDHRSGLAQVHLPVHVANILVGGERIALHFARLQQENRPPEVAVRLLGDPRAEFSLWRQLLPGADVQQDLDNLLVGGRGHSHAQATRTDRRNDAGGAVDAQDDPAGGHVLLHGATEGVLGVLGEFVDLGQDDHLELALTARVELVRLGDMFDEVHDDHAIVDADVGGVHFQVVVAGRRGEGGL